MGLTVSLFALSFELFTIQINQSTSKPLQIRFSSMLGSNHPRVAILARANPSPRLCDISTIRCSIRTLRQTRPTPSSRPTLLARLRHGRPPFSHRIEEVSFRLAVVLSAVRSCLLSYRVQNILGVREECRRINRDEIGIEGDPGN